MSFNIEVEGGTSVRLPTAGKYCDRDIVITATGGGKDLWQYVYSLNEPFKNATFPTDYELTLNLPFVTSLTNAIYGANKLKKLTLTGGNTTGGDGAITGLYCFTHGTVTEIDFSNFRDGGIRFASTAKYPFYNCTRLQYIRGEIDMSAVTSALNYFYYCNKLIDVRFKKGTISVDLVFTSTLLCEDFIQSVVDGYADMSGKTSPTLTVTATVGAKFTEAQKATLTAKNVTLAY